MNRCVAVVPVKPRAQAKRRLAPRLAPEGRLALTRAMLAAVIDALDRSRCVDEVVFVSRERDTLPPRYRVLDDPGEGLNAALEAARAQLAAEGAGEILVLAADLPLVTPADIDAIAGRGRAAGFALAPDRAGRGTNALYLSARAPVAFRFGGGSRGLHLAEARQAGLAPAQVECAGLAFDVDSPADLEALRAAGDARYAFLSESDGGAAWLLARTV